MKFAIRQAILLGRDLLGYGSRSGRWWIALVIPTLTVAAVAVAAVKAAAPVVVYAFF